MLSSVLNKSTCAGCKFCCSFRRCSLWETPLFDEDSCRKLGQDNEYGVKADFKMSDMKNQELSFINQINQLDLADGQTGKKESERNAQSRKAVDRNAGENKINPCGSRYGQMQLEYKYKTDDSEEEAACEFLDPQKGCILSNEDKPFDCKIWPLRIMNKDGKLVIALTPTCPALGERPSESMQRLVDDGLGQKMYEYALEHPFMIKEYHEGFPVLMTF